MTEKTTHRQGRGPVGSPRIGADAWVSDYTSKLVQKFTTLAPRSRSSPTSAMIKGARSGYGSSEPRAMRRDPASRFRVTTCFAGSIRFRGQASASPTGIQLAGWDQVGTFPASGESEYFVVVPTLADATAASLELSAYHRCARRPATSSPSTTRVRSALIPWTTSRLRRPARSWRPSLAGVTQLTWEPSAAARLRDLPAPSRRQRRLRAGTGEPDCGHDRHRVCRCRPARWLLQAHGRRLARQREHLCAGQPRPNRPIRRALP